MKFKAAILDDIDEPLIVDDIEIPKLYVGQVLVKIFYSGICGAQLAEISGANGQDNFLPHLLGHEGSGFVVDVGEGVYDLKEGDRVIAHWRCGKGIEAGFPVYKWGNKVVGGGRVTTFSEYSVISENRLTKIDTNIALERAALMGCSLTTALGLINNEAELKIGQSIMVIGCGGIGLSVIQGAKMVSGNPIIAVDITQAKAAEARKYGADMSIIPSSAYFAEDLVHDVKMVIDGVDIVVDTTGNPTMIEGGWLVTKEKMILVGQPHYGESFTFKKARDNFFTGKVMMDSQGGMTDPNIDIPRYLELYEKKKLEITDPVFYPLEKVNDAIRDMKQGVIGKVMLEMNT